MGNTSTKFRGSSTKPKLAGKLSEYRRKLAEVHKLAEVREAEKLAEVREANKLAGITYNQMLERFSRGCLTLRHNFATHTPIGGTTRTIAFRVQGGLWHLTPSVTSPARASVTGCAAR